MKKTVVLVDPETGDETEVVVPALWQICSECQGEGKHPDRNIDGNGITSSEWAEWDEEDRQTYLSGGYDVVCGICSGDGKVLVVDPSSLSEELRQALEEQVEQSARWDAEDRKTRRMESGGWEN